MGKKSTVKVRAASINATSPKVESRREYILQALERDGQVRISQLAEELNTTTVTIRTDLTAMEKADLVERVPGGAIPSSNNVFSTEFQKGKSRNAAAKRAIAARLVEEVEDGDTIFINGGTTTYYAGQMLKRMRKRLVVITNSISIALDLSTAPTFTVVLAGGQVNPYYSFTYGMEALDQLRHYQVKKAILSIDGIAESGIMTIHPDESTIARMMIERSRQRIIIADSSKVGVEGLCTICGLDQISMLITDSDATPQAIKSISDANVEVCIVSKEE